MAARSDFVVLRDTKNTQLLYTENVEGEPIDGGDSVICDLTISA
jgi:hypothetical protein